MIDDDRGPPQIGFRAQRLLAIMQRDPPSDDLIERRGVDGEWRRPGVLGGFGRKTIHDLVEAGLIEPRERRPHEDDWIGWFRLTAPTACDPALAASLIAQMDEFDGFMRRNGAPDTLWGLVLRHGVGRFGARLPYGMKRRRWRHCFEQAAQLATWAADRFVYCEGYAVRPQMPILIGLHAWALDRENGYRVVDDTWTEPETGAYFGIPFSLKYLTSTLLRVGQYGIIDNWQEGYPLIEDSANDRLTFLHADARIIPRDFFGLIARP